MKKPEYNATYQLEENHWWFVGMRRITANLLARQRPKLPHKAQVLDAGCGTGGSFPFLSGYGTVTGVDISRYALHLSLTRGKWPVLQGSVDKLPFADESFDMLTCFDVLSQVPPGADDEALREFSRVLKKDGLFVVRVPAYQWLRSRHDRILGTEQRYNLAEMKRKIAESGFHVETATHVNAILFPLVALWRLIQKLPLGAARTDLVEVPGWLNSIFLTILNMEAWLVKRFELPFGLSIMAVARKGPSQRRSPQ